jgi:hypothetical protein
MVAGRRTALWSGSLRAALQAMEKLITCVFNPRMAFKMLPLPLKPDA